MARFINMGKSFQRVSFLVGLLCMITITAFSSSEMGTAGNAKVVIRCKETERQSLLHFKQGLRDPRNVLSSWRNEEEECCRWKGIACHNQTGHVVRLDVSPIVTNSNVTDDMGQKPDHRPLRGEITTYLLELQHLNHLDLSYNDFNGKIPEFIGSFAMLTYLNLSWCNFSGTIPQHIGNLSNLRFLDLTASPYGFTLGLEVESLEWVSRLSTLRFLNIGGVNLGRAANWAKSIEKLHSLQTLDLSYCHLPELIPSSLSYINSSLSLSVLSLQGNWVSSSLIFTNSSIFSWLLMIGRNLVDLNLSFNILKGPIPDSFGDMTSLAHLDLSSNSLKGPIPDSFGDMASLAHLDLRYNELEGGIPKSLGNLCNLKSLDLSFSNLTIQLSDLLQNLTGCTKDSLEILSLSGNKLSGSLLDITRFTSLRELYLYDNQLEGSLPKRIGNLSKLVVLDLGSNKLNGSVPESIGQLSSLRILDVSSNSLNGTIHEAHLSKLPHLQHVDFSNNSLVFNFSSNWVPPFQLDSIMLSSCKLGPHFPGWLRTQNNFSYLDISNSKISDVIPDWFWNLSSNLLSLDLSSNNISGKATNLSLSFDGFSQVDLSSNLFYGPIPPFHSKTTVLKLSNNKFSGSISFLCKMMNTSTSYLDLSHNQLSGDLPDCWMHWKNLTVLNLEHNNFSGKIPTSMESLWNINSLRLRHNNFSGHLPSSLKNCSQLKLLDLGENKISGKIPAWIGESLTGLIILSLRSNEFDGMIPPSICYLRSLQVLDLSLNNISGTIPLCLDNLTAMVQKGSDATISYYYYIYYLVGGGGFEYYTENVLVTWKGMEREYGRNILGLLKFIDISSNKLIGEIPGEVTSLLDLRTLNLSNNNLSGTIPEDIGQLLLLESLDLSKNHIHGRIPDSLAVISSLSTLNLSNNNLSGRIPSGTQLQGFEASRYMGNPQLCGPPLPSECPGKDHPSSDRESVPKSQESRELFGTSWSYASIGFGFAFGFLGVCGTLIFNGPWRHAYFQFLEDKWDWLYVVVAVNVSRLMRRI